MGVDNAVKELQKMETIVEGEYIIVVILNRYLNDFDTVVRLLEGSDGVNPPRRKILQKTHKLVLQAPKAESISGLEDASRDGQGKHRCDIASSVSNSNIPSVKAFCSRSRRRVVLN